MRSPPMTRISSSQTDARAGWKSLAYYLPMRLLSRVIRQTVTNHRLAYGAGDCFSTLSSHISLRGLFSLGWPTRTICPGEAAIINWTAPLRRRPQ
jgi:hypothetical protein